MSLQEKLENIKPSFAKWLWRGRYFKEYINIILVLSLITFSFFLGSLSVTLGEIHSLQVIKASEFTPKTTSESSKTIVASRSGTKYYYIWCSGVGRIKEKNRVFFNNAEEAREAGYEKSKNCPGE